MISEGLLEHPTTFSQKIPQKIHHRSSTKSGVEKMAEITFVCLQKLMKF